MRIYAPIRVRSAIAQNSSSNTYHHVRLPSFRILTGKEDIPEANPIATAVLTAMPEYMKQLWGRRAFWQNTFYCSSAQIQEEYGRVENYQKHKRLRTLQRATLKHIPQSLLCNSEIEIGKVQGWITTCRTEFPGIRRIRTVMLQQGRFIRTGIDSTQSNNRKIQSCELWRAAGKRWSSG